MKLLNPISRWAYKPAAPRRVYEGERYTPGAKKK